ncbi:hypothetical protein [Streptomyces sp. NPDC050145]|uniref:hypothetical protein n=1 Tax=Streptomyces sp. NPDC050145 TaxID=3365602 RepID=UPI0037BC4058
MSNIMRVLATCAVAGAALATAGTAQAATTQIAPASLPTPLGPVGENNNADLPSLGGGLLDQATAGQGVTQNIQGSTLGGLPIG